mgnify:CR=1 FL=1
MRTYLIAASLLVCAIPAAAQQHGAHHGANHEHAAGGEFPAGWEGRVDRPGQQLTDVRFMAMGNGFHIITGPHVILWNPAQSAAGAYTAAATFKQERAPERREGFGLFVGGRDLNAEGQDYLYFLIRHDGSYMIRHRAGTEVHTLADWTQHDAIRKPTATEAASNTVAVESADEEVRFLINGQIVNRFARVPMLNTDGLVGFRVGHHADVHVLDFTITPR